MVSSSTTFECPTLLQPLRRRGEVEVGVPLRVKGLEAVFAADPQSVDQLLLINGSSYKRNSTNGLRYTLSKTEKLHTHLPLAPLGTLKKLCANLAPNNNFYCYILNFDITSYKERIDEIDRFILHRRSERCLVPRGRFPWRLSSSRQPGRYLSFHPPTRNPAGMAA